MSAHRAPDPARRHLRRACDPLTMLLGVSLALPVALAVYAFDNDVSWARPLFFTSFGFAGDVVAAVILRMPRNQWQDGDDADELAMDAQSRRATADVDGGRQQTSGRSHDSGR